MEYEFHPAANLFPMMSDDELDSLGEDMLQRGQREPIILYNGQILDGRNRYRACVVKGIEPKFRSELVPDPYAFVATVNLHRRHLSEEQRGMIAARLATMKQGDNQHSPNGETSQAKAAELLKVSKRRVERSHEVIEKGVPDLVDAVERRDVKVSAAAEFAKVTPPLDQQRLIAEYGSAAAAVSATVKAKADRAASKMPRPVADPKRAADRAQARAAVAANPKDVLAQVNKVVSCIAQHTQGRIDHLNVLLGANPDIPDDALARLVKTLFASSSLDRVARIMEKRLAKRAAS